MKNKRVLIITYYWPPSGGSGVQRWLKFAKFLPQFGWTPVIYTPENPSFGLLDESLLKDVNQEMEIIRHPIWEPYDWFQRISGIFSKGKTTQNVMAPRGGRSAFQKLSTWIRGNLFIPDPRVFWVKPSIKFLTAYVKANPVDVIISTGPPHSMHLIGRQVAKALDLPWLADFRDPWTTMDYYADLKLTSWADKKHRFLEGRILREADAVTVVGNLMKAEFEQKRKKEVVIIPNGYDHEDFNSGTKVNLDQSFSLLHAGTFLPRRNPVSLWRALAELKQENHPLMQFFKIILMGRVDPLVLDSIRSFGLEEYLSLEPYQPHEAVVRQMQRAQVLLLPIDDFDGAKWVITGKLYEYIGARRPILCIGPTDGDAAKIIRGTASGMTFDFPDVAGIKEHLVDLHARFRNGSLAVPGNSASYSRQGLTGKMAEVLDKIVK